MGEKQLALRAARITFLELPALHAYLKIEKLAGKRKWKKIKQELLIGLVSLKAPDKSGTPVGQLVDEIKLMNESFHAWIFIRHCHSRDIELGQVVHPVYKMLWYVCRGIYN